MILNVLDVNTKQVKTINSKDILYTNKTGMNGSVNNITTVDGEYRLMSNSEITKHIIEKHNLMKSNKNSHLNISKIRKLNNVRMSAQFDNGKETILCKRAFVQIKSILSNTTS